MLGNWCNTYDKMEKILKLKNNSIIEYHWNDTKKVERDYVYLNNFAEKILIELAKKLNNIHGVNYSKNYWRIVLSNWLFSSAHVIFDKWETLKKAFSEHSIESTILVDISHDEMIQQSIENFTDILFRTNGITIFFLKLLNFNIKIILFLKKLILKMIIHFFKRLYF